MIRFKVTSRQNPRLKTDTDVILLQRGFWDDWFEFSTDYFLTYVNEEGKETDLGTIKIGEQKLKSGGRSDTGIRGVRTPDLPIEFDVLNEEFFSLGQDANYYRNLENLGG